MPGPETPKPSRGRGRGRASLHQKRLETLYVSVVPLVPNPAKPKTPARAISPLCGQPYPAL
jgi:hypothetical protein